VNNHFYLVLLGVKILGKYSKIGRPISQISLAFSGIGFLFGWFTSAGFYGFVIMGACAAVPLLIGPKSYRAYGAIALLIAVVGARMVHNNHKQDPYFLRAKVNNAFLVGSDYSAFVEGYWEKNRNWPNKIDDLNVQKTSENVRSLILEANGTIKIVLSFQPLENTSLIFVPTLNGNAIEWRCFSNDIPDIYLPSNCKHK